MMIRDENMQKNDYCNWFNINWMFDGIVNVSYFFLIFDYWAQPQFWLCHCFLLHQINKTDFYIYINLFT